MATFPTIVPADLAPRAIRAAQHALEHGASRTTVAENLHVLHLEAYWFAHNLSGWHRAQWLNTADALWVAFCRVEDGLMPADSMPRGPWYPTTGGLV